jgi:hypothetical protein
MTWRAISSRSIARQVIDTDYEPLFLESNGIIRRGKQYLQGPRCWHTWRVPRACGCWRCGTCDGRSRARQMLLATSCHVIERTLNPRLLCSPRTSCLATSSKALRPLVSFVKWRPMTGRAICVSLWPLGVVELGAVPRAVLRRALPRRRQGAHADTRDAARVHRAQGHRTVHREMPSHSNITSFQLPPDSLSICTRT